MSDFNILQRYNENIVFIRIYYQYNKFIINYYYIYYSIINRVGTNL